MSRSDYYLGLTGDVKVRYDKKLELIDGVDPYTLSDSYLSLDLRLVPPVTIVDLMNYVVLTHSYYTGKQLKAYKSLQAYKYYEAEFVHEVSARKFSSSCVVVAKVMHSQRRREKPLQVWIILLADGSISTAHCTCMAGLGEVCSHIAAVLFYLEAHPSGLADKKACTEMLARWPIPTTRNVDMMRIRDMDWAQKVKPVSASAINVTPLEGEELCNLLSGIQNIGIDPAIARVLEPFASTMKMPPRDLPLGYLDIYFKEHFLNLPYEELLKFSKTIISNLSEYDIKLIEEVTYDQSQSSLWFKYRAGRITASKFKATSRGRIEKPALSLIKSICYPQNVVFYSKQTSYGIKNEKKALVAYLDNAKKIHSGIHLKNVGFCISPKRQEVGASPDGIVSCTCHGSGCVEVKCPYLLKDLSIEGFIKLKSSCLIKNSDNEYVLDRSHAYYYQVQLQMFVTNLKYCDFVVWSKNVIVIDKIYFDEEFCINNLQKSFKFHEYVVKPELIGKYFTRQEGFAKITMWCTCAEPDDLRPMLKCDNDDCDIQWFHFDCMGLLEIPESTWFCENCK